MDTEEIARHPDIVELESDDLAACAPIGDRVVRLVASAFVPKTCALADQLVHLDGDSSNCRADNLAWRMHPSRDPACADSEI
jgi:hypothetical protein